MRKPLLTIVLGVFLAIANQAAAQTATATPDPALAALQAQQAILDAKLKILQDQQGLTTGVLPASTTTPNSGAFTVSGTNPFPGQKLAYDQLEKVACQISESVKSSGPIGVYDQVEINNLVNLKAISKQLNFFGAQVNELTKRSDALKEQVKALQSLPKPWRVQGTGSARGFIAPILMPGLAESSLKTVVDMIGLFRTNTTIAYNSFTPDDAALTAQVAQALRKKGKTVYEPAIVPVSLFDEESDFLTRLSSVQKQLATVQNDAAVAQATIQQISDALGVYVQADQAATANRILSAQASGDKKQELVAKQPALDLAVTASHDYAQALLSVGLDRPTAIQARAKYRELLTLRIQNDDDLAQMNQIDVALGKYIQADIDAEANRTATALERDIANKNLLEGRQEALDTAVNNPLADAVWLLSHDRKLLDRSPGSQLDIPKAFQKKADCDQFLKVMAAFIATTSTISTAFGTLQTALMKVTDSGAAALTAILRAEKLSAILNSSDAAILLVKTSVLGGSTITRTNLWTGGHLFFSGGAIANFTVFNRNGEVQASGVVVGDSGIKPFKIVMGDPGKPRDK